MTTSRQRAARISELSFNMTMTKARAQLAQDRERERAATAAARYAALQPRLAAAGYGPHGAAPRLRAEARAVRAASRSAGGTSCTGPDCRICAEGRRIDAARGRSAAAYAPGAVITTGYREIAR
jgi:hypothetical protein